MRRIESQKHLADLDIDRLLDGNASAWALAHLDCCLVCAKNFLRHREAEVRLGLRLYRADCPTSFLLGEWALGLLDHAEYTRINDHLTICAHCRREARQLRNQSSSFESSFYQFEIG